MKRSWFIPIAQTLIICFFLLLVYAVSWFGQTYTFEASSLDPFDATYQNTVYLDYDAFQGRQEVESGVVYMSFKQGEDGFAEIDRIQSKPFFGGIRGNYYDRAVYVDGLNAYQVTDEEAQAVQGVTSYTVQVDVAPWGMMRLYELKPNE